jgi:Lrp/AsnC family transcriptional regulator for asnA, asnC and gidA
LDAIDAAIIQLLQADGRASAVEMARQLPGVSPRVVRYRIDRLREAGVISVVAVVHPQSLGYGVIADVMVETEPGRTLQIVDALADFDQVRYVAYTGDRDISIQVVTRSVEELHGFIHQSVQLLPGVTRTRTYLLPETRKPAYNWELPSDVVPHAETRVPGTG